MRRITITFFFIVTFSLAVFSQQPCKEYGPAGSVLSICPPVGMTTIKKDPGELHASFFKGAPETKDAAVLVIVESQVNVSLGEFGYEMISQAYADTDYTDTVMVAVGDIQSANGVRGLRLVLLAEIPRKGSTVKDKIERIYYLFDGPKGTKVLFNAQIMLNDTAAETALDNAIKTLRIKK